MRVLLAITVITGFAASPAFAECGHSTTAQSKPPVIVAQNITQPLPDAADAVDDTLTGSVEDEALLKKRKLAATAVE